MLAKFDEKCGIFEKEQKAAMEANTDGYKGMDATFMAYSNPEVITHFPP